jgi:two-component system, LytTR family, sensor kinase
MSMGRLTSSRSDAVRTTGKYPSAGPLRRGEVLVVVAVWAFFAVLNVATWLLEPRGGASAPAQLEVSRLVGPAVWAVLTVFVFWLSRRLPLDGAFWRRHGLFILLLGIALAHASDAVIDVMSDAIALPPSGVRRFDPGLTNSTIVDDFGVFLTALAAGIARASLLRERAQREAARRRAAELEGEAVRMQAHAAKLQAQLAVSQVDALRRQLDPHFLFNTLNTVSALVERDARGVRRMIGQLSDLLRHSMNAASAPEIPLRQELELLERYVDIMRVRFEDQLAITTRADPRALEALVPNMILQPLVENAIRHGVERRAEGGRVDVEAALEGDTLVLCVRDDGPGMTPWVAPVLEATVRTAAEDAVGGGGVGLRNTAARLAQLYGADYRFTVGPGATGGTVAEVRLPCHTIAGSGLLPGGDVRAV